MSSSYPSSATKAHTPWAFQQHHRPRWKHMTWWCCKWPTSQPSTKQSWEEYLVSSISKTRTDKGLRQIMYGKYQTTHHSRWWPDLTLLNLLLYTSKSNSSTLGVGQEHVMTVFSHPELYWKNECFRLFWYYYPVIRSCITNFSLKVYKYISLIWHPNAFNLSLLN